MIFSVRGLSVPTTSAPYMYTFHNLHVRVSRECCTTMPVPSKPSPIVLLWKSLYANVNAAKALAVILAIWLWLTLYDNANVGKKFPLVQLCVTLPNHV